MKNSLSTKDLRVFAALPRQGSATLAEAASNESPAERQRIARRLEALRLVDTVRGREKKLRVAAQPFAVSLHGMLQAKPHVAPLLAGARLPILAALATTPARLPVRELARVAQAHPNTVYRALGAFMRRALIAKKGPAYRLADHVPDLRQLATDYVVHVLQIRLAEHPTVRPVLRNGLRLIVASDRPIPGLPATAHYRFRLDGAEVLAARYQYAVTLAGAPVTEDEALDDAKAIGTAPRTLAAIETHVRRRRGNGS